jgi:hypothetical protein
VPGASLYRLKQLTSASDPDFAAAMLLYVRNTRGEERTDTNEIAYWLDQFRGTFGDIMYAFAFFKNHDLVGYAQAVYFVREEMLAIDYLVVDAPHRGNNVFFEFVDQLKQFFDETHPSYRYALAEVCYGPGREFPSPHAALVIRLLKMQGFRLVRATYFQPRMLLADAESEMRADLLLHSREAIDSLHAETFLDLVRTLYFKHYQRWQTIVKQDEPALYAKHLDTLFARVRTAVGRRESVVVNGHAVILQNPTRRSSMRLHRVVRFSVEALLVVLFVMTALLGMRTWFGLSSSSLLLIGATALGFFVATAAIVSNEARKVLQDLLAFASTIVSRRHQPAAGGRRPPGLKRRRPGRKEGV